MDVKDNAVDKILYSGFGLLQKGNYKGAIALVEPLLKGEKKKTLSPQQERLVVTILGKSNEMLGNHKAALPHAKRAVELCIQLCGTGSEYHATALNGLGQMEMGLKEYKSAQKRFNDAMAIFKELGMEKRVEYGSLLMHLARVDIDQERWKEALEGYVKAKGVMKNFKEDPNYGVVVNAMAICYENLNMWTDALQFYREGVELHRESVGDQHPEYATTIFNLADAYVRIKQPTIAIRLFEEALVIRKRVFGDKHPNTIDVINALATARELEKKGRHEILNPGDVRMCNNCEKVTKEIDFECEACKNVNYCNQECFDAHWPVHQPDCSACYSCSKACDGEILHCSVCHVARYCSNSCLEKEKDKNDHNCAPRCYQCRKDGLKLNKCSVCLTATYCSAECQKKHWPIHKGECKKK